MANSIKDLQNITLTAGEEISHDDVGERIPELWGAEIEKRADIERILRNYVRVNDDLVGRPGDTVKLPRKTYYDSDTYAAAAIGSDATELTPNFELTFETVSIEPIEIGLSTRISKQAIDEVMLSLLDEARDNMADAVADKEDQDILSALVATTAGDEVTYIEAKADSTEFTTGDWTVAQAALDQDNITSADVLDLSVIVEASEVVMHEAGFVADTLIIHPRQKASLLRDANFIDASKAGTPEARKKGVIGELYGLEVITSRRVPTITISGSATGYQAILMDRSAAAVLAVKRPVTIETKYEPSERMHYIYFTSMYKAQRVNSGAVVLINTA